MLLQLLLKLSAELSIFLRAKSTNFNNENNTNNNNNNNNNNSDNNDMDNKKIEDLR